MAINKGLNQTMYDYYKDKGLYSKSQFGELLVASRMPIIELNSSYGTSALRDIEATTGTGSISLTSGELKVSTGATSSSTAKLDSAEIGRYIAGYGAELGIGVRIATDATGTQVAKWGGMGSSEDNGIYFGQDSTGIFVATLRDGTETKVYQTNWNIDKADGTGDSGYTLDMSKGAIFQIMFTWYGHGQIMFGVLAVVNNTQRYVPVHQISNQDNAGVSILTPNLRVFAEADNNDESSDLSVFVGGRQYSIIGDYVPKYRFTGDWRGSVATSTTIKPLVSFRRKSAFNDRSIKLSGYDVVAATEPCIIEIRLDGSLTSASFGTPTNYTASETALDSDKSATAITGGEVLWSQLVPAGQNKNSAQLGNQEVDVDIPNGSTVTLCARAVTGTGTILSSFRMREEW